MDKTNTSKTSEIERKIRVFAKNRGVPISTLKRIACTEYLQARGVRVDD